MGVETVIDEGRVSLIKWWERKWRIFHFRLWNFLLVSSTMLQSEKSFDLFRLFSLCWKRFLKQLFIEEGKINFLFVLQNGTERWKRTRLYSRKNLLSMRCESAENIFFRNFTRAVDERRTVAILMVHAYSNNAVTAW